MQVKEDFWGIVKMRYVHRCHQMSSAVGYVTGILTFISRLQVNNPVIGFW